MSAKPKRLMALDVLRGLTIVLMIIVNNPGSWSHVYAPLLHSKWHGWTPTDLVFPFFLFMVGTAMWYSFKKNDHKLDKGMSRKIIRRTVLIFLIGIFLNAFPVYTVELESFRIMGVLQRIAIAYGVASFIVLLFNFRNTVITSIGILLGYWVILLIFGGQTPFSLEGNIVRNVDLFIFGENHMYGGFGIPFDPEGLLSTLPATVNVLFGFMAGRIIDKNSDKLKAISQLVIYGTIFLVVGLIWDFVLPINKPIWTSSYVLVTCGLAGILLAMFIWVIDIKGQQKWAHPLLVFGMNPLFIYVLAGVWARLLNLIKIPNEDGLISLNGWMYNDLLLPWFGPYNASLLFALHLGILFWLIGLWLFRKKIFIKI